MTKRWILAPEAACFQNVLPLRRRRGSPSPTWVTLAHQNAQNMYMPPHRSADMWINHPPNTAASKRQTPPNQKAPMRKITHPPGRLRGGLPSKSADQLGGKRLLYRSPAWWKEMQLCNYTRWKRRAHAATPCADIGMDAAAAHTGGMSAAANKKEAGGGAGGGWARSQQRTQTTTLKALSC